MIRFISILICTCSCFSVMAKDKFLSEETIERLSPNSFNRYYKNIYSQCGEDGILEEIFLRLNIKNGFFVEFGAADGICLSNTRYLWEKGWSGVMIEADKVWFNKLIHNYSGVSNVMCLNLFVSPIERQYNGLSFDNIKNCYFPDKEIDFLSIDIDGLDYLVLENLICKPKVILIEAGLHWHPLFNKRIPDDIAMHNLQQPLPVIVDIAKQKGYFPICLTGNLFLIREDFHEYFNDAPKDVVTIWKDGWRSTSQRRHLVHHRKTNKYISNFEGPDLQKNHKITEDY